MRRTLTALGLSTCLLAAPAMALDLSSMSEEERANFRAEVRAYLLENPEVLMEAIAVLEGREAQAAAEADRDLAAANKALLTADERDWVGGNPEGDITVVEFIDYRCGFCRRAHPEVAELIETDGNIRLIVKEFPILGEQSMLASRFALSVLATEGDAAYKRVSDALIALRSDVTETSLSALSDAFGYDTEAILAGMEDEAISRKLADNRALAQSMQITGTPTFVIGGEMLRGYAPLEAMREIVAEERG